MNARTPIAPQMAVPLPPPAEAEDGIDLVEYWDIVVDHRWLIGVVTALAIAIGAGYAFLAAPVYEANLLIQVEDSGASPKSFLGDASNLIDVKTASSAEIEIIRSRMIVGQVVDNTRLYIDAQPRYLPLVGNWLSRRARTLSEPGLMGFGGFVSGTEKIGVAAFDVPQALAGSEFRLTAQENGRFALSHPALPGSLGGTVGSFLVSSTPSGKISLLVSTLEAKPGAEFSLRRRSRLTTIVDLQAKLKLAEKGRQTGILDATLQSTDREQLTLILNEVGRQYVRQNIERKAAEAQKMLAFLSIQMPQFKKQLEQSEEAYTKYRTRVGTVALDAEANMILNQMTDLHAKLLDAQQKRIELVSRFTGEHPIVRTLDEQSANWRRQVAMLDARVHAMPTVQQDALRFERDVRVNNDAYQSLRSNELQLQLVREGKVGNVRVIDEATLPESPVKPQKLIVLGLATVAGLVIGLLIALARNAFNREVRGPQEIETQTGLSVYTTIPLSKQQERLARQAATKQPGMHLLAALVPDDAAVESLRSLRTALQFAMVEASNNLVLVTGATPGVGKSFVAANFAVLLASAGKRVLLVDADLRKGHLNQYFGIPREGGLSELVSGTLSPEQAVRRGVLPNLDLLTTGVLPPNPAELMMSAALVRAFGELESQYDLVIVDSAPVLAAADTLGFAAHVGTLLLVARAGQTQVGELLESSKRLAQAGKSANGVIFNAIDLSKRHYGSYGYKYGGYRYRQYSYASRT